MLTISPLMKLDLVGRLRQGRTFRSVFVWLAVSLLLTSAILLATDNIWLGFLGQGLWHETFCTFATYLVIGWMFMSASSAANYIIAERRRGTLEMLLATPLRSSDIILGKVFAATGHVAIYFFSLLPFFSVLFLFGGVEWREMALFVYLVTLASISHATAGLATAIGRERSKTGLDVVHGFLFAGLNVLIPAAIGLFLYLGLDAPQAIAWAYFHAALAINAAPMAFFALTLSPPAPTVPLPAWVILAGNTLVQVLIFVVFLWWGCRKLRRDVTSAVAHVKTPALGGRTRRPRPGFLTPFPIPRHVNPVAAKDVLLALPKKRVGWYGLAAFLSSLLLLGIWGLIELRLSYPTRDTAKAVLYLGIVSASLLASLISFLRGSGTVALEYESPTLPLLVAAPMKPLDVILGKLLALLVTVGVTIGAMAGILAAALVMLYPAVAFDMLAAIPVAVTALAVATAFYGSIGIRLSAGARSVRAAGYRASVVVIVAMFLAPLALGAIVNLLEFALGITVPAEIGYGLLATLFPSWFVLGPALDLGVPELSWFWFLFGVTVSVGLTIGFVKWSARVYAIRACQLVQSESWKDEND